MDRSDSVARDIPGQWHEPSLTTWRVAGIRSFHAPIKVQRQSERSDNLMRSINRFLLSSGVVATVALAACGPADNGDEFAMDTSAYSLDTTTPAAAPMPTEARSFDSDAQILTFLKTANAFEIEGAQLAVERATTEAVREFAQTVHDDHEALRNRLAEVESGAPAVENELDESDDLVSLHRDGMEDLAGEEGADFDRAWLEHQIEMHERALDGLESALAANPTDEVRMALTEAQTGMRQHLETAQRLRDQIANAGT